MGDAAMQTDTPKGSTRSIYKVFNEIFPFCGGNTGCGNSMPRLRKYLCQMTWTELIKSPDALNL